jgi:O-succinylbenzoate synthase
MRLRSPFETSFGTIQTRDCILIEAKTNDITGYGECVADRDPGYSYETTQTAWHMLRDFLIPSILKQEINNIEELQNRMRFVRGHPMAKAGIEMAFWDLTGKETNRSLFEILAGVHEEVAVGVSVGIQKSPSDLVDVVEAYLNSGYGRIKIKIKPGRDISDVQAVRRAFPNVALQVDANSSYSLSNVRDLKELDKFNLLMIEQPLDEDDLWDHSKLQKQLSTPLCLDESILSTRHTQQALEMGACRIINIKSGRVGGIHEAVSIHNFCLSRKIPVWCGGMLETGVGRSANLALASLPGFILPGDISATDRYYLEDITYERFSLNPGSTISVPRKPGLGISIDTEALKQATHASITIK